MSVYVLDACALLAYLLNERGADQVDSLLRQAQSGGAQVRMHRVNLFEVLYRIGRVDGLQQVELARELIGKLPLSITDRVSVGQQDNAIRIKLSHKMSLADALAVGFAIDINAALVTSDHHEFDALAQAGYAIHWIR